MSKTYYSQFGEDEWITINLRLPNRGVYVDIGAYRPDTCSNTAFLRDMGWTGIAIDANPDLAQFWDNPKLIVAVLSDMPEREFKFNAENLALSRVDFGGTVTQCRRLKDILNDNGIEKIDFLSIDVEGHEFNVMKDFRFDYHQPSIIVAEYNTDDIGEDWRLHDLLLEKHGYKAVHQTIANVIYAF
jgi:FkbM family methyltransferase